MKRLYALIDELPIGLFYTDAEGYCEGGNAYWQSLTSHQLGGQEKVLWLNLVHSEDYPRILAAWQQQQQGHPLDEQFRLVTPAGDTRWVAVKMVPDHQPESQQVQGYAGTLTDITALQPRDKINDLSQGQPTALSEIEQNKALFFSNVIHELRTPLSLILGPLNDLLDNSQALPVQQQEQLKLMRRNVLRLLKLVNGLLDFSRLEAKCLQPVYQPTDVSSLTADLASVFQAAIEKAGLRLLVNAPALEEKVYIDREMWEKIIFNLLSNALKFTLEGEIRLEIVKRSQAVEITVQDTGVGMSEGEAAHIFERFYQSLPQDGRGQAGSGIGLTLVHEFVKLHGGTIQVTSTPQKGTTFILSIPLGKAHLPAAQIQENIGDLSVSRAITSMMYAEEAMQWLVSEPQPTAELQPGLSSRGRVLVVDDNKDMCQYLQTVLEPHWAVQTVTSGAAALAAIDHQKPDLLLADVLMLEMDGLQLIRTVREQAHTQAMPIIILSALASEEARIKGLQAGADDYLIKPFSSQELVARVKIHLGIGKRRASLEAQVEQQASELQVVSGRLNNEKRASTELRSVLKQSQANYQQLTTLSPAGIFHADVNDHLTFLNQQGSDLLHTPIDQIEGKHWLADIHPDDRATVEAARQAALATSAKHFKAEYRYVNKQDNAVTWVVAEVIAQQDANNQTIGYIGTLTDITELKQAELSRLAALEHAKNQEQRRAEDALQHKQQLQRSIDALCHELRTPLNIIYGCVDLLQQSLEERRKLLLNTEGLTEVHRQALMAQLDADQEAIENINQSALHQKTIHQKTIADDVLDLSKLDANLVQLNIVEFQPKKILRETAKMLELEAKKKNLEIFCKLPAQDIRVLGDPNRLRQILFNLLNNALKFTHRGKITLALTVEQATEFQTTLKICVKDTGIGIKAEEKAHLFERFKQANVKTHAEFGGSGLGLYISKGLVELMGGKIQVASEEDKGSKFTFTVQCGTVCSPVPSARFFHQQPAAPASPLPYDPKTMRILIVEDNIMNQKVMLKMLTSIGYPCQVANNGQEAVELARHEAFDVILMDIEMPVMNGLTATEQIRLQEQAEERQSPAAIIIGLSSNARDIYINTALAIGMNDYLAKPVKVEHLNQAIAKQWQQKQSLLAAQRRVSLS